MCEGVGHPLLFLRTSINKSFDHYLMQIGRLVTHPAVMAAKHIARCGMMDGAVVMNGPCYGMPLEQISIKKTDGPEAECLNLSLA